MTVFAACAIAGAAVAVDSNIVGYVTKATDANKMDILGVPFQNVGDTVINIQDVTPGVGFSDGGDLFRLWDSVAAKYVSAYYFGDTYAFDTGLGDIDYGTDLGPGWADGETQERLVFTIEPGQGFWLTTRNNASVTIAGEVLAATDNEVSTQANKMDILCNTFPVDANIQDVTPVSGFSDGGDLLRIWDPVAAKYVSAYYFGDTYAFDIGLGDIDYGNDLGPGWADGETQERLDFQILAGQGFWLTTRNNAVVSFPAPAGIL